MITCYHGTTISAYKNIKNGINFKKCRYDTDFGRGFYLTKDKHQAIEWAEIRSEQNDGEDQPCVIQYELTLENRLSGKEFSEAEYEWGIFVVLNRIKEKTIKYDYIIGPMADGGCSQIGRKYKMGIITIDNAVNNIVNRSTIGDQICLTSKNAIKCLKEVGCNGI